jgi:hypothetical protein
LKGDHHIEEDDEEGAGESAEGGSSAVKSESLTGLQYYTITGPTLEEVFMNVAREAGVISDGV